MSDCTWCGSAMSRRTQAKVCKPCRDANAHGEAAARIAHEEYIAELEHLQDSLHRIAHGEYIAELEHLQDSLHRHGFSITRTGRGA